jgi:putative ABC transport system permease protein
MFTAERRTREIGIRKVLGSSVSAIVLLLSREFARWVLLANLIAWPLAYLVMKRWLENFAYSINLSWQVFLFSGLVALAIALITVIFQSARAALANPVDSLRQE